MITFTFEGVEYGAPMSFYDLEIVQLPDGRCLSAVGGFLERNPPSPMNLRLIDPAAGRIAGAPQAHIINSQT